MTEEAPIPTTGTSREAIASGVAGAWADISRTMAFATRVALLNPQSELHEHERRSLMQAAIAHQVSLRPDYCDRSPRQVGGISDAPPTRSWYDGAGELPRAGTRESRPVTRAGLGLLRKFLRSTPAPGTAAPPAGSPRPLPMGSSPTAIARLTRTGGMPSSGPAHGHTPLRKGSGAGRTAEEPRVPARDAAAVHSESAGSTALTSADAGAPLFWYSAPVEQPYWEQPFWIVKEPPVLLQDPGLLPPGRDKELHLS